MKLFTTTAKRRSYTIWLERAQAAYDKILRVWGRMFAGELDGTVSPRCTLHWQLALARCQFYIQRAKAALAAL